MAARLPAAAPPPIPAAAAAPPLVPAAAAPVNYDAAVDLPAQYVLYGGLIMPSFEHLSEDIDALAGGNLPPPTPDEINYFKNYYRLDVELYNLRGSPEEAAKRAEKEELRRQNPAAHRLFARRDNAVAAIAANLEGGDGQILRNDRARERELNDFKILDFYYSTIAAGQHGGKRRRRKSKKSKRKSRKTRRRKY